MEDYHRSKAYADEGMQIETYHVPRSTLYNFNGNNTQDFRSYSASYASSSSYELPPLPPSQIASGGNDLKLKKRKSICGSVSKSWSFNDPELQRKKRVASYKVYSVEGIVKGSLRKSFRWLKYKCNQVVHGWG